MEKIIAIVLASLLMLPAGVFARGGHRTKSYHSGSSHHSTSFHRGSASHSSRSYTVKTGSGHSKRYAMGVRRDNHGKILRSTKAKSAFLRNHPCPSTGKSHGACPGYVVDHITPLKGGGADAPSNMQWQTKAEAKSKDKWE